MMAAEEISKIVHEVLASRLQFCAICLRTESKLVESETFVLCAKKLRHRIPFNMLCVVCDAQVRRAWHTLHAITFAASISTWYQSISMRFRHATLKEIQQSLQRFTMLSSFGEGQRLGAYWRRLRARTRLAHTDTLVVSSEPDPPPPEETDMVKTELITPDRPASPTLSISPLPAPFTPLPSCSPEIENVVVIDDDDIAPAHHTPLPRANNNIQHVIAKEANQPYTYVLYPILQGNDKNMYVPYLNLQLANDALQSGGVKRINNVPHNDKRDRTDELSQYKEDNEIKAFENNHIHNFNEADEGDSGGGDMGGSGGNLEDIVVNMGGGGGNLEDIVVNVGGRDGNRRGSGGNLEDIVVNVGVCGGNQEDNEVKVPARDAVMSGKVDWEDKIPMDVISFVDATDPNAQEFLNPEPPPPLAPPPAPAAPARSRRPRAGADGGAGAGAGGPKRARAALEHSETGVIIDLC